MFSLHIVLIIDGVAIGQFLPKNRIVGFKIWIIQKRAIIADRPFARCGFLFG